MATSQVRFLSFRKNLLVEGGAERFMAEVIYHMAKTGADAAHGAGCCGARTAPALIRFKFGGARALC